MLQITMLITGVVLACKAGSWRTAVTVTMCVFIVSLAVQTPFVAQEGGFATAADVVAYMVIQVVSLAVALGLARFGLSRRTRPSALAGQS